MCVERLNATVSNLSRSHPASHNNFSPQHFSTPKRDGGFFSGPRNFRNSSQNNLLGPAAHATYSKTHNRNQTSKDVSLRSENEFNKPNSDLCFYHARFGASARSCMQPCNWRGSRRSLFQNPRDKPVGLINANLGVWMVKDPNTSVNFMVDTGSAVSLLPCFRSAGDKRLTGHMTAANGTLVPTYETIPLTVTFGLRKSFKWNFLRAGVSCAILGLDFLTHFGFVLDLANKALHLPCHDKVDAKLTRPRCGSTKKEPDVSIAEAIKRVDNSFSSEDEASQRDVVLDHKSCPELPANFVENSLVDDCSFDLVDRLCTFYSDLFDVDNFKKPTKHKTQHHIRTSGPPCVAKVRN